MGEYPSTCPGRSRDSGHFLFQSAKASEISVREAISGTSSIPHSIPQQHCLKSGGTCLCQHPDFHHGRRQHLDHVRSAYAHGGSTKYVRRRRDLAVAMRASDPR